MSVSGADLIAATDLTSAPPSPSPFAPSAAPPFAPPFPDPSAPPPPFAWFFSSDLSYPPPPPLLYPSTDLPAAPPRHDARPPVPEQCYRCGAAGPKLVCPRCKVARYCNQECYKLDWKRPSAGGFHKLNCGTYSLLTRSNTLPPASLRPTVEASVLNRVRMYLSPIACLHHSLKGPGFVYLQSPHALSAFAFPGPGLRDAHGPVHASRAGSRSLVLTYVPIGEFPQLTRDDFEVAEALPHLTGALKGMDPREHVLLLVKFRCGFLGVLKTVVVLGYDVCLKLAEDYKGQETYQLDIDDV